MNHFVSVSTPLNAITMLVSVIIQRKGLGLGRSVVSGMFDLPSIPTRRIPPRTHSPLLSTSSPKNNAPTIGVDERFMHWPSCLLLYCYLDGTR